MQKETVKTKLQDCCACYMLCDTATEFFIVSTERNFAIKNKIK